MWQEKFRRYPAHLPYEPCPRRSANYTASWKFAGHASITETQRYLKFMPEQIELAARSTTHLAQLANAEPITNRRPTIDAYCSNWDHIFEVELPQKGSHLSVVPKTGTHDQ